ALKQNGRRHVEESRYPRHSTPSRGASSLLHGDQLPARCTMGKASAKQVKSLQNSAGIAARRASESGNVQVSRETITGGHEAAHCYPDTVESVKGSSVRPPASSVMLFFAFAAALSLMPAAARCGSNEAPSFSLRGLDGKPLRLSDYRGK